MPLAADLHVNLLYRLRRWLCLLAVVGSLPTVQAAGTSVPILAYHRFGDVVTDSMMIRTSALREQLDFLRTHKYVVVPLNRVVEALKRGEALPARAVVITVDDGHRSVETEMRALVEEYRVPVTLFIYPSAISNASYALTWDELRRMKAGGLFDIQSHTLWHPNFKTEKRRLAPADYQHFVAQQMQKPRQILKARLGVDADLLAWPFGIVDDELAQAAATAGYQAALTIDRRRAQAGDADMRLPRFMIVDSVSLKQFAKILDPDS
jgi:peptidoglycan/xylan/chitin deacetylase (PgdA/CDA1 family)